MSSAAYETTIVAKLEEGQFEVVLNAALEMLRKRNPRFRIERQTPTTTTLHFGINWRSYGERVLITTERDSIRVVSECSFPLQIVDWGKNRINVEAVRACILSAMDEVL